jgi:hypothetical protein
VIRQREYSPLNPYALGFAAWNEIKRVCDKPTAEDREYLPEIAGKDWLETFHDIMQDYRDESFLLQFLTPKLVRDFKLMNVKTQEGLDHWTVSDTAGPEGFKAIRSQLSALPAGVGDAGNLGGPLRARYRSQARPAPPFELQGQTLVKAAGRANLEASAHAVGIRRIARYRRPGRTDARDLLN